jgi:hypothetical protein
MLCLPASAECCGSELGLIECESLTSLPSQVETKHNFEVLKLFTATSTREPTSPTAVVGRPSDWAQTARILPGSSFVRCSFFGRPNNLAFFQGLTKNKLYHKIDLLSGIQCIRFCCQWTCELSAIAVLVRKRANARMGHGMAMAANGLTTSMATMLIALL